MFEGTTTAGSFIASCKRLLNDAAGPQPRGAARPRCGDGASVPAGMRTHFAFGLGGMPVAVISKLLGHSSITATVRYLDHLTNHQAVTAAEGVDLPKFDVSSQ